MLPERYTPVRYFIAVLVAIGAIAMMIGLLPVTPLVIGILFLLIVLTGVL